MSKCQLAKKLHMVLINLHLVLAILFGLQCVLKVWIYTWWCGSGTSLHMVVVPFINVTLGASTKCFIHWRDPCARCFSAVLRLSGIVLRFWAPESAENLRGVYWRFAFVFRIVALEYWCLGVSLSNRVFGKLIRAVSVWRQLAQQKRPVIRYTIIRIKATSI